MNIGQNTALTVSTPQMPRSITERMGVARELAKARNMPPHFSNSPADIYMLMEVCEQCNLNFSLAVWEVSNIKGRIMFSGKMAAAMLNNSGRLAERLQWSWSGEGDDLTCTVTARLHGESEPRVATGELKKARTPNNANWVNDPRQQLAYFTTRKWGRLHLPEVLMGAVFEGETIDITPNPPNLTSEAAPSIAPRQMTDAELDKAIDAANQAPAATPETVTQVATPFTVQRRGDDATAWSLWARELFAYIKTARDDDERNEWTLRNADDIAALKTYDAEKHARLIKMIKELSEQRPDG